MRVNSSSVAWRSKRRHVANRSRHLSKVIVTVEPLLLIHAAMSQLSDDTLRKVSRSLDGLWKTGDHLRYFFRLDFAADSKPGATVVAGSFALQSADDVEGAGSEDDADHLGRDFCSPKGWRGEDV